MTIAELFVNIGVKGSAGVGKALGAAQKGMGDLASSSLMTKAAVLGVIVGLERLTGFASQIGMDLYKFNTVTGLSTDELQKWQYAAMQFDVSGQEMAGTIRGVQNAMSDMKLGKGAPEALGLLAQKVGFDPKRMDDTYYVLGQIQKFAKTQPAPIASNLLKSFGISDNVFQFLKASNLEIDKMQKKGASGAEISRLTAINKEWKEIWYTLKMIGVHTVAKEGMGPVKEVAAAVRMLSDGIKWVEKLTDKFSHLKEIIVGVGLALALALTPFMPAFAAITVAVTALVTALGEIQKFREGKSGVIKDMLETPTGKKVSDFFSGWDFSKDTGVISESGKSAIPTYSDKNAMGPQPVNNVYNINTTVHGVEDAKEVGPDIVKSIRDAKQQNKAISQVN